MNPSTLKYIERIIDAAQGRPDKSPEQMLHDEFGIPAFFNDRPLTIPKKKGDFGFQSDVAFFYTTDKNLLYNGSWIIFAESSDYHTVFTVQIRCGKNVIAASRLLDNDIFCQKYRTEYITSTINSLFKACEKSHDQGMKYARML